jgi:hypothetical protein
MLVTTSPYQFLVDLSKNALTQYTNKYKWPKIDRNDSFFSQGSQDWYEFQLAIIENFLAEEIIEEFECTFTQGVFNPTMRTSYYKWELIFKKFIPERYKIWSKPNISPKPTIDDNEVAKGNSQNINDENLRNLKNYLNDLIRDIIFEGEKLKRHLPFIKGMSEKANLNADNITQEFKDFIELYYNAIADKRVTKFERTSLYLQGEFALLDRQTVDSLIPDYYNE